MVTHDEFARMAIEQGQVDEPFEPFAQYNKDGDCIEYVAAPDSFYAQRVDDVVTVYYSHQTNKMVGSQIKGIKRLLENAPGLVIDIHDGQVALHHVIRATGWANTHGKGDTALFVYRKLVKLAEDTGTTVAVAHV